MSMSNKLQLGWGNWKLIIFKQIFPWFSLKSLDIFLTLSEKQPFSKMTGLKAYGHDNLIMNRWLY